MTVTPRAVGHLDSPWGEDRSGNSGHGDRRSDLKHSGHSFGVASKNIAFDFGRNRNHCAELLQLSMGMGALEIAFMRWLLAAVG